MGPPTALHRPSATSQGESGQVRLSQADEMLPELQSEPAAPACHRPSGPLHVHTSVPGMTKSAVPPSNTDTHTLSTFVCCLLSAVCCLLCALSNPHSGQPLPSPEPCSVQPIPRLILPPVSRACLLSAVHIDILPSLSPLTPSSTHLSTPL